MLVSGIKSYSVVPVFRSSVIPRFPVSPFKGNSKVHETNVGTEETKMEGRQDTAGGIREEQRRTISIIEYW